MFTMKVGQGQRPGSGAASVAIAQDRIREKDFLVASGCAVAPYAVLRSKGDAQSLDAGLAPGIVKSARMGYDGKGQIRVQSTAASESNPQTINCPAVIRAGFSFGTIALTPMM